MGKQIYLLLLLLLISCSSSNNELGDKSLSLEQKVYLKKKEVFKNNDFVVNSNDFVISKYDKYLIPFNFSNKDYKLIATDEEELYKLLKVKINMYNNIGLIYLPKQPRIICNKEDENSFVFMRKDERVETIKRKDVICSKKSVDLVLELPNNINMFEIEKLKFNFENKSFIDKQMINEIFKEK